MDEIFDFLTTCLGEFINKKIKKFFNIDLNFKDGGNSILGMAFIAAIIAILIYICS